MKFINPVGLVRTSTAARILDCSTSYVLALVRLGKLDAHVLDGYHYFEKATVEALAAARRSERITVHAD